VGREFDPVWVKHEILAHEKLVSSHIRAGKKVEVDFFE